jgi:hypothetical protein
MLKLSILHVQYPSVYFLNFWRAHRFHNLWAFLCPVFLRSLTGWQLRANNLKVSMSTNANPGNDPQSRQPGHKGNQKIEFCLM